MTYDGFDWHEDFQRARREARPKFTPPEAPRRKRRFVTDYLQQQPGTLRFVAEADYQITREQEREEAQVRSRAKRRQSSPRPPPFLEDATASWPQRPRRPRSPRCRPVARRPPRVCEPPKPPSNPVLPHLCGR